LLALHNYNATMEIISALGNSSISRLKKTWTDKLEQQYQPYTTYLERNFAKLRTEMSTIAPPLLPYIGIFMKDLMMIDEGNDDYTESNLLNWQKMKMQAQVIHQIVSLKNLDTYFQIALQLDFLLKISTGILVKKKLIIDYYQI